MNCIIYFFTLYFLSKIYLGVTVWLEFYDVIIITVLRDLFMYLYISASYKDYIGIVCMFAKILNCILYVRQNPVYGAFYAIICLCKSSFLHVI